MVSAGVTEDFEAFVGFSFELFFFCTGGEFGVVFFFFFELIFFAREASCARVSAGECLMLDFMDACTIAKLCCRVIFFFGERRRRFLAFASAASSASSAEPASLMITWSI